MAFPDDLHLTGIIDEIQFKHPIGHGIIDFRLVFYAENGEDPSFLTPFTTSRYCTSVVPPPSFVILT